jgi:Fis family transcriptional regulator, factor for inversion stimulation protein
VPGQLVNENRWNREEYLRWSVANVKDQLEGLVNQMVERGILFDEAVGEFEKRFIKRILDRVKGNQSRAAEELGIHRNTLSRKIGEYKLDHNGHRKSR